MNDCDCFLGFLTGTHLSKSDVCEIVNRGLNVYNQTCYYRQSKPLTIKQYIDGRRGYLSRFTYCPYCGEKINWGNIIKQIIKER